MKRVLLTASLIVILIAFFEIVSSLYYFLVVPAQNREMLEPLLGVASQERQDLLRYQPHPYFNYVFNRDYRYADGFKPYNSHGFRSPEWTGKKPGTTRIVAVGGSTTYGIFSRDGKNIWPAFLEKRLNAAGAPPVEVVNLGVTGYTLFEIMGVVAMTLPELEPDVVLIHAGVNDAFAACYADEGGADGTRFRFSWRPRQLPEMARVAMRTSYTLRVLGYLTMSLNDYLPGDLMTAMQHTRPNDGESRRNAARATGKYYRRNLATVVSQAASTGADVVVFTQPLSQAWETVESPFFQGVIAAHKRNNEIIREVAQQAGVAVVDLAGRLRAPELFVDAMHPNLRGEELQAQLIYPEVAAVLAARKNREPGSSDAPLPQPGPIVQ